MWEETRLRPDVVAAGGFPVLRSLVDPWAAKDVTVVADFGTTEAESTILTMSPRGRDGASAISVPVIHAECSVSDLDGTELPAGRSWSCGRAKPLLTQG